MRIAIFTIVVILAIIAVRVDTNNYPLLWKLDMALTGRFNSAYRTLTPYPLGFIANKSFGQTDMGLAMQAYQFGLLYLGYICAFDLWSFAKNRERKKRI